MVVRNAGRMVDLAILAGFCGFLGACQGSPSAPASEPLVGTSGPAATSAAPRTDVNVSFFDADAFDSALSKDLNGNPERVHIFIAGNASVNAFPPRLNSWLRQVKDTDGTVTSVDPANPNAPATRGIITELIDLVMKMKDSMQEREMYKPAERYNAVVNFDSTTGNIREVTLTQR